MSTPLSTRAEQLADVLKLYLQNNPDLRDYTASSIVADALAQAFPCSP